MPPAVNRKGLQDIPAQTQGCTQQQQLNTPPAPSAVVRQTAPIQTQSSFQQTPLQRQVFHSSGLSRKMREVSSQQRVPVSSLPLSGPPGISTGKIPRIVQASAAQQMRSDRFQVFNTLWVRRDLLCHPNFASNLSYIVACLERKVIPEDLPYHISYLGTNQNASQYVIDPRR